MDRTVIVIARSSISATDNGRNATAIGGTGSAIQHLSLTAWFRPARAEAPCSMETNSLGTVARIWRYPVKSLRAESLSAVTIGANGLEGDRRRALHVSTPDRARTGKTYRGKENNLLHTTAQIETARL